MAHNQGGLNGIDAISGVQAPDTSAVQKISLQNYDSNPVRANQTQNQTQFLSLTARGNTRAEFNWKNLNFMPDTSLNAKVLPAGVNRQLGIG